VVVVVVVVVVFCRFYTGTSGPAFFGLGMKESLLALVVVDILLAGFSLTHFMIHVLLSVYFLFYFQIAAVYFQHTCNIFPAG
jgi:hypothetical protein